MTIRKNFVFLPAISIKSGAKKKDQGRRLKSWPNVTTAVTQKRTTKIYQVPRKGPVPYSGPRPYSGPQRDFSHLFWTVILPHSGPL